jgi:sulfur-carrier protein
MNVKIRFFARFGQLFGNEVVAEFTEGQDVSSLVKTVAQGRQGGMEAIFDGQGLIHESIILIHNGKRLTPAEAQNTKLADDDSLTLFPGAATGS